MRDRIHSTNIDFEKLWDDLSLGWGYFVEVTKVERELFDMLNTIGIILAAIVILYTLGKLLLFYKAKKPILFAILPFAGIWTLHKLAWGKGSYAFISLIPGLGWLFFWITLLVLCARFNGGILSYLLTFMFFPVGIFILGITGKSYVANVAQAVGNQYSNGYPMNYGYNNGNATNGTYSQNNMDNTDYQSKYDEVWGDVLKK